MLLEADRLCDRVAIVDHGERIALDTPYGLRGLLPGGHGIELILRAEIDPTAAFEAVGEAESVEPEAGRWRVRCFGDVDLGAAIAAGEQHDGEVLDVHRLQGSLKDVFVHLTGRDLR